MGPYIPRPKFSYILKAGPISLLLLFILRISPVHAQCAAAPIAAAACSGGSGAATAGQNITSGTWWVSASTTFSTLTLNGGTLRVWFDNETDNSFTYSGAGSPACIKTSGTVTLNHPVTTSNKIHACQNTTTPSSGWGSAPVTTSCSSCATVFPMGVTAFSAG